MNPRLPAQMPERMPAQMPEQMPERMPTQMHERMPESICQHKCPNHACINEETNARTNA